MTDYNYCNNAVKKNNLTLCKKIKKYVSVLNCDECIKNKKNSIKKLTKNLRSL
jgi:hypothetical protein